MVQDSPEKIEETVLPLVENGIESDEGRDRRRRSPPWLVTTVAALLLVFSGGVLGLYFQGPALRAFFQITGLEPGAGARDPMTLPVHRMASPERVEAILRGDVVALGRLRPKDGTVIVATPFGAADSRIEQLLVEEGDQVVVGDLLAVLDSSSKYEAALVDAESKLASRRAVLGQVEVQVAAARAETEAYLRGARVTFQSAEARRRRAIKLLEDGIGTQEDLDAKESDAAAAKGEIDRLEATLSRYEEGPLGTPVDVAVAMADVDAAEDGLAQAKRDLELARVRAPRTGTVLELLVREGERAPGDGILRLGYTQTMEAEVEVYQSLVPRVELAQAASIESNVLGPQVLMGTVVRIGRTVGRQSITSDDPAANTDARVVVVVVELDKESSERAADFVGLEVIVRIGASDTESPGEEAR